MKLTKQEKKELDFILISAIKAIIILIAVAGLALIIFSF